MTDDKNMPKMPHNVIMENRKKLSVSGVTDIDSFDEQNVIALMLPCFWRSVCTVWAAPLPEARA